MKILDQILKLARRHCYKSALVVIAVVFSLRFYLIYLLKQADDLDVEKAHKLMNTVDFLAPFLVILILIPIGKKPREPEGDGEG